MRLNLLCLLALAIIFAGCSSEDDGGGDGMPNAGSPLLGDWFRCMDATCTALYVNGIRYAADGNLYYLYAYIREDVATEPPFMPGNAYCFPNDGPIDRWTYDPDTEILERLYRDGTSARITFTLEGADRGTMDGEPYVRLDNATGAWDATTYSCLTRS